MALCHRLQTTCCLDLVTHIPCFLRKKIVWNLIHILGWTHKQHHHVDASETPQNPEKETVYSSWFRIFIGFLSIQKVVKRPRQIRQIRVNLVSLRAGSSNVTSPTPRSKGFNKPWGRKVVKKSFKGFFLRKSTDDWLGGVVILDLDDLKNIWIFADAKIVSCNHLDKIWSFTQDSCMLPSRILWRRYNSLRNHGSKLLEVLIHANRRKNPPTVLRTSLNFFSHHLPKKNVPILQPNQKKPPPNQNDQNDTDSLKLTFRPWKSMVGRWNLLSGWPIYRGYVSFREGITWPSCFFSSPHLSKIFWGMGVAAKNLMLQMQIRQIGWIFWRFVGKVVDVWTFIPRSNLMCWHGMDAYMIHHLWRMFDDWLDAHQEDTYIDDMHLHCLYILQVLCWTKR